MAQTRLFGTDGIRAEVGAWPLVPDFVVRLGFAAGRMLMGEARGGTLVVGRDTRQSGPMLQSALTAGLLASGVSVIDAGVITTPGVAYLARRLGAVAGAVISASHNPVHENGLKFFGGDGLKLPQDMEVAIERWLLESPEKEPQYGQCGRSIDGRGLHELYIENLLAEQRDLQLNHLAIAVDCANGAASWFAPECLARLGARVIAIHASPTGLNINDRSGSEYVRRHPNDLARVVRDYGAHFGMAFDGDADRVVFVDEHGGVVDGDHMLAILANYFEARQQLVARSLVTTHMRNEGLVRFARSNRFRVSETPVGDKYVVEVLVKLRSESPDSEAYALGGEQAGHVVLMDNEHTTGDGIRTALFMTRVFVESGASSLADLTRVIQKMPQVIASAYVGHGPRLDRAALDKLEAQARVEFPALKRVNLRYSGTEAQFRAMLESDEELTQAQLAQLAWRVCRKVQSVAGADDGFIEILDCAQGGLLMPEDSQPV
ncbi:MAG TPA: phosphoglucosamine mutase [Anaerolineae bacterium]